MISFVYFDVGGVVIDDFSGNNKWSDLKSELGITSENERLFDALYSSYNREFCIDREVDSFLPILEAELGIKHREGYSLLDGFVKRFSKNEPIWPAVAFAQQHAKIGLLTNMYPGMFAAIQRRNILPKCDWDVLVDSSIEHLQKPDEAIFRHAELAAGVAAREILFVDNSPEHVEGARACGWQAYHYDSRNHETSSIQLLRYLEAEQYRKVS